MVLVHESDARFGAFDFRAAREKAPPDLQDVLDNHESLPFRRRGYERDGMLQTLIEHAGFKALLQAAQASATATAKKLAKVPTEIQHFDLESFHDRPVQTALVELLLPKHDERFTSCVVMHGMGGTGKTVTTVAVVQEQVVRAYFSHIYWLTVGADAVGEKIRQLQSALHTQLTGKGMRSAEVQQKDEQEWQGLLVEAMPMERSLVVLDDPWLPEQVRFLNPVDSAQTEHRLLITTRIRGLAHSRAACIELSMMGMDEAVQLLLDVAGITKQAYQIEHPGSQWPPLAAYSLATECGLLPITLTITAQLVRSWGKGWEKAVLPLLQEEHGPREGRGATTVEERIVGAGLKSLKGEDVPAIKALFEMLVVTQEDFLHPMAVIELLWRLCCTSSTKAVSGLSARLKVRQWTQVLIDQSLLLGSSAKGVHMHDIVLTYLRGTRSALELRALQKRVVDGMVAASKERMATTGRGFQDTGSTAKAFDGEEVDWYVCNVASYHVKQSMDLSMSLMMNEDLKRLLLLDDETIVRAAAVAVGMSELESLLAEYSTVEEWIAAAKVAWAMGMVSGSSDRLDHGKMALGLLAQAGSATPQTQQLELDMRGTLAMTMRTGNPDYKVNIARMTELMAQNKSLRVAPLALAFMSILPALYALFGVHPKMWDAGKIATADTVTEGFRVYIYKAFPLFVKAAEESVGARKECIHITYELAFCAIYMSFRSTDQTAEMHQQFLEEKWGRDGSLLTAGCMEYILDRHYAIAKGIGARQDIYLYIPMGRGVAEHCGDVHQMVQIYEKQLSDIQEFVSSGSDGIEAPYYSPLGASSYLGMELESLHPFGKGVVALFNSWQCTDPSECEACYESAAWAAWRAYVGEGLSSKDGLHHMLLKANIVLHNQAILALSLSLPLASAGTSSFDLSWLDGLPASDDPKLFDGYAAAWRFANTRIMIAEVLEWQGRHKEAIRCMILLVLICIHVH
jgi:hypothetical protein